MATAIASSLEMLMKALAMDAIDVSTEMLRKRAYDWNSGEPRGGSTLMLMLPSHPARTGRRLVPMMKTATKKMRRGSKFSASGPTKTAAMTAPICVSAVLVKMSMLE